MSLLSRLLLMGLFVSVMCIGFGVGLYFEVQQAFEPTPRLSQPVAVSVPAGAGTQEIAAALKQAGIIRSSFWFRAVVSWYAIDQRLKPGNYPFSGGEDLNSVVHALIQGREEKVRVTIPEGLKLTEIAELVERAGLASASAFFQAMQSSDLIQEHFGDWGALTTVEGLAFPETYTFAKGVTARQVAAAMMQLTRDKVEKLVGTATRGGLTRYQACILASIVEKEAKLPEDRPLVASVFMNRLKAGMRFESCATVQYALGEHKERLTYDDLKVDSPYNTYLKSGLPPAPISNFGTGSLKAVAEPAETDYLFFVSDAADGHRFSRTLGEHERSKRIFLEERRRQDREKRRNGTR